MRRSLWTGLLLAVAVSLAACNVDQSGGAAGSTNATQAADANTGENPAGDNTGANPQGQIPPVATLSADQTAANQQFSQLTVGILYLQDNQAGSITKEQAAQLLTYYQDIQTRMQSARDAANDGTPRAGGPGGAPDGNGGGPGGAPDANGTPQAGGPGGNGGRPAGGFGGGGGFGTLALIDLATLQTDLAGIQSTLTADQLSVINALTEDQLAATMQQHGQRGDGAPGDPPQQEGTPDPDQMATMQAQGAPGGRQGGGSLLLEAVITVLTGIAAG